MISYLKGKVIDINQSDVTLLINESIGYKVNIAQSSKYLINQEVSMYIYTSVKETEISLWGFENKLSLSLFENLISVSGVGTKTAMILISEKGIENIVNSVVNGEYDGLKVTGVGPKTAQRIVIELKSKLAKFSKDNSIELSTNSHNNENVNIYFSEALEALVSLGYREQDVKIGYSKIATEELDNISNSPELVRLLLKFI